MASIIDYAALFTAFATLFVVIDPIGLAPIFVALTQGMAPQKRKAIALRACVIAFVILSNSKRLVPESLFMICVISTVK